MISYNGIVELCGHKGTGKSNIAMQESKNYKTLYLCSNVFPISRYFKIVDKSTYYKDEMKDRFFIKIIHEFVFLKFLIDYQLEVAIVDLEVELLVIDALDHLLYTEVGNKTIYSEIFEMITKLKELQYKYNLKVLIINCWYESGNIDGIRVGNRLLGISWSYLINTRILVEKKGCLKVVMSPVEIDNKIIEFEITENGIKYNI
ncbi:DNA repair protein XRCC3 like protein [Astathelohania contejeani]|uniref:DNA repair protein XRCC3 like protein n=1 Tax=Astathelohania contejeani TaxID=164912 RepID=A0ABQ7HZX7_9MICR|nr:DNA repair protein XRCC3 like protein [Thelohania contejeani]